MWDIQLNLQRTMSNKYSQTLLDSAKKSARGAIKTASKRAIQKIAEATGHLIANKNAEKKTPPKEMHSQNEDEIEVPEERYISPEKTNKLLMN